MNEPSRPPSVSGLTPEEAAVLQGNLSQVQTRIHGAAAAAARPAPALVAVTKTQPPAVALGLARLGCMDLAENRPQGLAEKVRAFEAAGISARWHYVGHLQRNKARRVLEHTDVLHSVDSPRLAATVVRLAAELGRPIEVFIQVNLTGETEKHGHLPEEAEESVSLLGDSPNVDLLGLMAMGPLAERGSRSPADVFGDCAELGASLAGTMPGAFHGGRCSLSMGMSGDLSAAIQHGSTHVRVGSALFTDLVPSTDHPGAQTPRPPQANTPDATP